MTIRPATTTDEAFVWHSWLHGAWQKAKADDTARAIGKAPWMDAHRKVIRKRIDDGARVWVAESAGVIVGWVCVTHDGAVVWGHVKKPYRGKGVFRALKGAK